MKNRQMHFHHWFMWGVLNGLIIYFAGLINPDQVVLGNATVSRFSAIILAALGITLIISLLPLILKQLSVNKISPSNRYLIYAFVNVFVIWLLSRMALVFGFGLESKYTALILGLAITIGQYLYWEKAAKKVF